MKEKRSFFEKLAGTVSGDKGAERRLRIREDEYETGDDVWNENTGYPAEEVEDEEDGELSVDVYQTDKELIIEAMVAGVKPEDLQVSITRDLVTISGKREANKSVTRDDYYYQELYWGTFSRSIMLPHEIDIDAAEAIEKHGMLIIRMPKTDKSKQAKLRVKSI